MTRSFAEVLLLIPAALCSGFVIFVACVFQGVMESVDEAAFKRILTELYKHAIKSIYAVSVASVTFVGMIPYFIYYGAENRWFTAGLIFWVITSIVSKVTNLPIYGRVFALDAAETEKLNEERRKLHNANILRAVLSLISIILMVIGLY